MVQRRTFTWFGAPAAMLVFAPLFLFSFFNFGLRECFDDCGPPWDLYDAWLMSALYAGLFGVLSGFAAGALLPSLEKRLRRWLALAILAVGIVVSACPVVWVAPSIYLYVDYLRTPRDQLPVGDPNRRPSDCSRRRHPANTICAV